MSVSPAAMFLSTFVSSPTAGSSPTSLPDDEGQTIQGYTLGPVIGYGGTSIIRLATPSSRSPSSSQAAVKIIRRSALVKSGHAPLLRRRLLHESRIWSSLSHQHILPLFEVLHTEYADWFFTLYCPAGSLFDILKREGNPGLPQDDVGMMFRQIVRGLRYLHTEARLVHRDVKLENILVDEMGVCRIADFGMARRIGGGTDSCTEDDSDAQSSYDSDEEELASHAHVQRASSFTSSATRRPRQATIHTTLASGVGGPQHPIHRFNTMRVSRPRHSSTTLHTMPSSQVPSNNAPLAQPSYQTGSLPYLAPELLLPQAADSTNPQSYSSYLRSHPHPSQDVWALGVVLYALLVGTLPWKDAFEPRLRMKILEGLYTPPPEIGQSTERILAGCLEKSMQARWTIEQVDDVAWGVGWGNEGVEEDDEDTKEEEIQQLQHVASSSAVSPSEDFSRGRVRNIKPTLPELKLETNASLDYPEDTIPHDVTSSSSIQSASHPHVQSASRRSSSRAQRSSSRAPVQLTDRSRRSASRGHTSPLSPLSSTSASFGSADGFLPSDTGSAFVERGRKGRDRGLEHHQPGIHDHDHRHFHGHHPYLSATTASSSSNSRSCSCAHSESHSHSRSASPSMVPRTPQDALSTVGLPTSPSMPIQRGRTRRRVDVEAVLEHPDEVDLSSADAEVTSLEVAGEERRGRPILRFGQHVSAALLRDRVRVASGKDSVENGEAGVSFDVDGEEVAVEEGAGLQSDDLCVGLGIDIDVVRKGIANGIGDPSTWASASARTYADHHDDDSLCTSPLDIESSTSGMANGVGAVSMLSAVSGAGWRSNMNSRPSSSPPVTRASASASVAGSGTGTPLHTQLLHPTHAASTPASSTPGISIPIHASTMPMTTAHLQSQAQHQATSFNHAHMPSVLSIPAPMPASPAISFLNSFWGGAPAPALGVRSRSGH